jgi:hypothetical protein
MIGRSITPKKPMPKWPTTVLWTSVGLVGGASLDGESADTVLLGIELVADEELVLLDPLPSIVPPKCAPPDAPTSPASGSTWAWATPAHASTAQTPTIDRFQLWFTSINASVRAGVGARSPMQGRGVLHPERRARSARDYTQRRGIPNALRVGFRAPNLIVRSGSSSP